jgi:hypothetical protein
LRSKLSASSASTYTRADTAKRPANKPREIRSFAILLERIFGGNVEPRLCALDHALRNLNGDLDGSTTRCTTCKRTSRFSDELGLCGLSGQLYWSNTQQPADNAFAEDEAGTDGFKRGLSGRCGSRPGEIRIYRDARLLLLRSLSLDVAAEQLREERRRSSDTTPDEGSGRAERRTGYGTQLTARVHRSEGTRLTGDCTGEIREHLPPRSQCALLVENASDALKGGAFTCRLGNLLSTLQTRSRRFRGFAEKRADTRANAGGSLLDTPHRLASDGGLLYGFRWCCGVGILRKNGGNKLFGRRPRRTFYTVLSAIGGLNFVKRHADLAKLLERSDFEPSRIHFITAANSGIFSGQARNHFA